MAEVNGSEMDDQEPTVGRSGVRCGGPPVAAGSANTLILNNAQLGTIMCSARDDVFRRAHGRIYSFRLARRTGRHLSAPIAVAVPVSILSSYL